MPAAVENMVSVKLTPWHKLGTVLDHVPTLDEAYPLSGLDFEVELVPLFTQWGDKVSAFATRRTDTEQVLGVVGPKYRPLQNREAFNWFQPFIDDGDAGLETAGCLWDGRKVWIQAKLNRDPIQVAPGDDVDKYVLLSNSHDGSGAVRLGFTPQRVVCNNTLEMAHNNQASQLLRVWHTSSVNAAMEEVRDTMNLIDQQFDATADQYRALARKGVAATDLKKYVRAVFEVPEQKDGKPFEPGRRTANVLDQILENFDRDQRAFAEMMDRYQEPISINPGANVLDDILNNFEAGAGSEIPSTRGSYWNAYNAVTEYVTHQRGTNPERRLESLWYGSSHQLNQRALDLALAATN